MSNSLKIGDTTVLPGTRVRIGIPLGTLPSLDDLKMHVFVVRGTRPGPTLFVSAAIHGDEINGVEIVRRVLDGVTPDNLCGTLIAVPIVNVFAFIRESRYLPDGRDLNRSFPGSKRGSLAARIARMFMDEIVSKCDVGIDLHTAVTGRFNLPHVRGNFEDPRLRELAVVFGAPVFYHSKGQDGTVRRAANKAGKAVLLYEGGEAGRFETEPIEIGVAGIQRVMHHLGMVDAPNLPHVDSIEGFGTKWVRARRGGLVRLDRTTGQMVRQRQKLGTIGDAVGEQLVRITAPCAGIIISHATNPLIHQGDAVIHIAKTE